MSDDAPPPQPTRRARARSIALLVAAIVSLLVGRAIVEGTASLHRSDERLAMGDVDGAIAFAMYATKWYVPLAPHTQGGYDRLRTLARKAESSGDPDTALIAWQAIRAGARGTASLWQPFDDRLAEADEHIAALLAAKPPPGVDRDKSIEQRVAEHRALLATSAAPKPIAVVVLYAGLAIWFFGAYRAVRELDRMLDARARGGRGAVIAQGLAIAAVGIVAFLFALARA